jgi:hypothetical protein
MDGVQKFEEKKRLPDFRTYRVCVRRPLPTSKLRMGFAQSLFCTSRPFWFKKCAATVEASLQFDSRGGPARGPPSVSTKEKIGGGCSLG